MSSDKTYAPISKGLSRMLPSNYGTWTHAAIFQRPHAIGPRLESELRLPINLPVSVVLMLQEGYRTLLRVEQPIRVFKKVLRENRWADNATLVGWEGASVIPLILPVGALFWAHEDTRKCRTNVAISQGNGYSWYNGLHYDNGKRMQVSAPEFLASSEVCSAGIHFFFEASWAHSYRF